MIELIGEAITAVGEVAGTVADKAVDEALTPPWQESHQQDEEGPVKKVVKQASHQLAAGLAPQPESPQAPEPASAFELPTPLPPSGE